MLQESVENITDRVNELVNVYCKIAIVGRDHAKLIIAQESETGEVYRPDFIQRDGDWILLRRQRLKVFDELLKCSVVFRRLRFHDHSQRVLDGLRWLFNQGIFLSGGQSLSRSEL